MLPSLHLDWEADLVGLSGRSRVWKGGFHAHVHSSHHAPFDADAMKVAAAVLTASNCRETVSLFANYTSSKEVLMETVETPLDPPTLWGVAGQH